MFYMIEDSEKFNQGTVHHPAKFKAESWNP